MMTPERIEQLATHREGVEWCLSVIPMGAGRMMRVRVRGAISRGNEIIRVDETREANAAQLATEIEALCRTIGVRLATKNPPSATPSRCDAQSRGRSRYSAATWSTWSTGRQPIRPKSPHSRIKSRNLPTSGAA